MFLNKIKSRESGLLLYGITPPKSNTTPEKIIAVSEKAEKILNTLEIDALVVYDVQDESARTSEERPFPFTSCVDPFQYVSNHLQAVKFPKIIYRPAGKFTKAELADWLDGLRANDCYPIFVGLPSPDYVVKTSLAEAYKIWRTRHGNHSVIGAVTIPERHEMLKDEDVRMLDKMSNGVSFFISQCIFNVDYSRKMLEALVAACEDKRVKVPTVIFTLTICGSPKTLAFMEWLGIHVPEDIKEELKASLTPLTRSVEIATGIATNLIEFCRARSIPFGFNIESVATRKEEVDASLELLRTVSDLLKVNGLRAAVRAEVRDLAE